MKSFLDLGVPAPLVQGLEPLGILTPTAIQEQAIPRLIGIGGDLIAQAQTGTGKTAAFGLPLLMKVNPELKEIQGLVIAPTRELAKQIGKQLFRFTKFSTKIFIEVVTGGENLDRQAAALQRPTHIVVATPGRLLDLIQRGALSISRVQYLILDEADEMLKMGFQKELTKIFELTKARQSTWLFSATIPKAIQTLVSDYMSPGAHSLKIDQRFVVNKDITHQFIVTARTQRLDRMVDFLNSHPDERGVIFCRTIVSCIALAGQLRARGFSLELIHGDLMQTERDKVMRSFKKSRAQLLIATDVAARGIDVEGLAFVLHSQLPDQIEYYTHRSGRTGRAGRKGLSLVFIEPGEKQDLTQLANLLSLVFTEIR